MEVSYKEFEVCSLRPDRQFDIIKCSYFDSRLKSVQSLYKDFEKGAIVVPRSPLSGEEHMVITIIMDKKRPYVNRDGRTEEGRYINYETFRYVPKNIRERNPDLDASIVYSSRLNEALFMFLQGHDHVVVNDKKGSNININCRHFDFILKDTTQQILDNKSSHEKKVKAGIVLGEVFQRSKDEFITLAYAMNIPAINESNMEGLYNEMALKIDIMPDFFLTLVADEDFGMIALINKGLNKNIASDGSVRTIIEETSNGSYLFDGEMIATNREELIRFFKFNDAKARHLRLLLGENMPKAASMEFEKINPDPVQIVEKTPAQAVIAANYVERDRKHIFKVISNAFKYNVNKRDEILRELTKDYPGFNDYILERINSELKKADKPEMSELNIDSIGKI